MEFVNVLCQKKINMVDGIGVTDQLASGWESILVNPTRSQGSLAERGRQGSVSA
jgi:hypothetical protein